ncbi:MAG: T9SS type A sorting domain-containing protein, partial [Calditrichaeota bacterium]|nr:T9SS type A sorting domain-containing protein [Calditrichota bacterium]
FSGDPESGTGWYQSATMSFGNRRLLMNFGMLDIDPGDTQSVIVAQIVSQGINNLNSVTKLKQNSVYIKNVFENNFTTVSVNESNNITLPVNFKLYQNYPNPFNPVTKIRYSLSKAGHVSLKAFDISGKEVITLVSGRQDAGEKEVTFEGTGLSSGIYFYRLTVDDRSVVKKMILQK